jgi:two-component system, sensor histidine kinase
MSLTTPRLEKARLEELHRYAVLDSEPEPAFDRVVKLTQLLFDVPFVLVTFIDQDRQWFKASYGVEGCETDLASSFCVHTIQNDDVMVVLDASQDDRFVDMPVVAGAPFYRFYAGAPLRTPNGYNLGTLCILDRVPHPDFSAEARATLADLAGVVVNELELRLAATEDAHQQLRRMALILKDVTEVVNHQRAELLRLSRLKDEFFAKMSHELRTPLAAIIGFSELLGDDDYAPPLTPEQRAYLQIISTAGQHLLALTNDLLDLSKIEAEMMELRLELVDVRDVVKDALAIIKSQAQSKKLDLRERLPERIAPLHADARKVKQVLYNLLSNAAKYTPAGGSIEITVEDDLHEVRVEVSDTGPGISPEDQRRLFQPFTQLENAAASEFGGTGLGLTLVKQLVELHGGRVWLRSRLGEGATFGFSVPRSESKGL